MLRDHDSESGSHEGSWKRFTTMSLILLAVTAGLAGTGLANFLTALDKRDDMSASTLVKPVSPPICLSGASRAAAAFSNDLTEAHAKMHEAMTSVVPTGDPDRDFLTAMLPHHQGALDMARAVLKVASDERVRRLAQSMIVEQAQEITYMRMLLERPIDAVDGSDRQ